MTAKRGLQTAVLAVGSVIQAWANGSRLPNQDAFAMARGYAFAATASDPSAVYYNPSGLAYQQASEIGGTYVIAPSYSYRGMGSEVDEQSGTSVLPHFFAAVPVGGVSLGVGFFAPYGLQTNWPDDSGFRNLATNNKITFTTGALSIAKAISPQLAIGASFEVDHLKTDLAQGIGFTPNDLLSYNGQGTQESWNLGLMWSPLPEHHFGISYESRVNFHLTGQLTEFPYGVNERGTGTWVFPDHLVFGYSYRPTPAWNFEADADWTHWSVLKTVTVNAASGPITLPFFWQDSWYYNFGATHYWQLSGRTLNVSAGYSWSGNSVPDTFYSPSVPDMSRSIVTLGAGYDFGRWKLSLALERGLKNSRTVTGAAPTPTGQTANGTYTTSFNALDVTEQYAW